MMRSIVIAATGIPVLLLQLLPAVLAFSRSPFSRSGDTGIDSSTRLFAQQKAGADSLKTELLRKIASLNRLQDEDGKIAVDFGVKGGEIDEKSRAPRKLDSM